MSLASWIRILPFIPFAFQGMALLSAWLAAHVLLCTLRGSPALTSRHPLKSFGYIIFFFSMTSMALAGTYTYGKQLCRSSDIICLHIKPKQSWQSLYPDPQEREVIMRINRMNTRLYPGLTIAIPSSLEGKTIMDFSPFPHRISPPGERVLVFDPATYAFGAYEADGTLLRWGPASGGADWCHDLGRACRTTSGHFRIYSKGSRNCVSRKFPIPTGGAPMPYCMFFYHGQAFHGSNSVPGYNASHSCVRLWTADAQWLSENFVSAPNKSNRYRGTRVTIGPYPTLLPSSPTLSSLSSWISSPEPSSTFAG